LRYFLEQSLPIKIISPNLTKFRKKIHTDKSNSEPKQITDICILEEKQQNEK